MYFYNIFLFYSIFGYFLETLFSIITKSNFKSGILYGPITPIYGIGAVIILFVSNYIFKNMNINKVYETIIVAIIVCILLSFLEVLSGSIIEKFFHVTYWNYKKHKYNIGKYISFEMTLAWAILSIIFIYLIHPLFKKIIQKIPITITIMLSILFIFSIIKTIIDKKLS